MNIIVVDLVIVYLDKNDYTITSLIIYESNFIILSYGIWVRFIESK